MAKLVQKAVVLGEVKDVKINEHNQEAKFIFVDGQTLVLPLDVFPEKYELVGEPREEAPESVEFSAPVETGVEEPKADTAEPSAPQSPAAEVGDGPQEGGEQV